MPDKDSRIEEIKQALEAATPGPWQHSPGDSIDEPAAVYVIEEDGIQTFTVADNLLGVDAHLIANAPEWLRWQQAEIERLKESLEYEEHRFATLRDSTYIRGLQTDLQQSREEVERLTIALHTHQSYDKTASELHDENERLRGELEEVREDLKEEKQKFGALEYANIDNLNELEQVKAERDDYRKVLEWYGEQECGDWYIGEKSRDIIARYEKGESQ